MQIFGIQNKTEKQSPADNGKNVVQGAALSVGVMKSDFDNRIKTVIPDNPFRENFVFFVIVCKRYGNRNIKFCDHINRK